MSEERLQKFLARCGVASRRASEQLILEGRVRVNGEVVDKLGVRIDPESDAVRVDGRRVRPVTTVGHVYAMLHKPRNVVTTLSDPQGRPSVRQWIEGRFRGHVFPVGRLDFQSEGLLLLTSDGDLARDLTHPRRKVPKVYRVKVHGRPTKEALDRVRAGMRIEGRMTLPARVRLLKTGGNPWLEISVVEGRKHLVRRLFDTIGHPVMRLRRVAFGGVALGSLPPGAIRPLVPEEVRALFEAVRGGTGGKRGSGKNRDSP